MSQDTNGYSIWEKRPNRTTDAIPSNLKLTADTRARVEQAFRESVSKEDQRTFSSSVNLENLSKILV